MDGIPNCTQLKVCLTWKTFTECVALGPPGIGMLMLFVAHSYSSDRLVALLDYFKGLYMSLHLEELLFCISIIAIPSSFKE